VRSTAMLQFCASAHSIAGFGRIGATSILNQSGAPMSRTTAVVGSSLFSRVSQFQA